MKTRLKPFFVLLVTALFLLNLQGAAVAQKNLDKKIQDFINYFYTNDVFTGTVLVSQGQMGEKIIYEGSFGMANKEWEVPNDIDAKMMIGSNSKQFCSLIILQEVAKGRISLQGTISDYLPAYRKDTGSKVTIHDLLSMQSGVPNYTTMPKYKNSQDIRLTFTVPNFIDIYCSDDLIFKPGDGTFDYSNSNYYILGGILEEITGQVYEDLFYSRIVVPLGITNTGYDHFTTVIPKRATGYNIENDVLTNGYFVDITVPFTAGAIYSTARDLNRWYAALFKDNQLLPEKYRKMMYQKYVIIPGLGDPLGIQFYYGYGLYVGDFANPANPKEQLTFIGHGGIFPNGFKSFIGRIMESKYTILVLANTYVEVEIDVPVLIYFGIVNILYGQPAPDYSRFLK